MHPFYQRRHTRVTRKAQGTWLAANYGLSCGEGHRTHICGHGTGKRLKDQFLRGGAGLLRAIGTALVGRGFSAPEIISRHGEKMTPGSVTARYSKGEKERFLTITLVADAYRWGSRRADGIALLAEVLTQADPLGLCTESYWLDAETDATLLAATLADIFTAQTCPDGERCARKRALAHHPCVLAIRQAGPCLLPQMHEEGRRAVVSWRKVQ